jgi:hypothetical protein
MIFINQFKKKYMKNLFTLIVLLIASTGLINQINAQVSNSIGFEKNKSNIEYQNANNLMYGIRFFDPANASSVQKATLKSTQECQEQMDSSVYVELYEGIINNGHKDEWGYDSDGNQTHGSSYYWDTNNKYWIGQQKTNQTYDTNGNLILEIADTWNKETRQWETGNKAELTYDSNGNLTLYFSSNWNQDTQEWDLKRKRETTNTYNTDSVLIINSVTSIFDNATNEWTISYRNELNFDKYGNMTLYNAEVLDSESGNWVFRFIKERAYDENGNQTFYCNQTWDSELNQWVGYQYDYWTESTYDAMGNATMIMKKEWNDETKQWKNKSKIESSYHANGLILQNTTYQWDSSSDDWLAVSKTENNFSEKGTLSKGTDSEWDNEQNMWVGISQHELIYDADGNLSQSNTLQIDTISGEWSVYAKDEYKYDVNDNEVLKETSTLNNNDQWIINNIKHTFYDVYGNVVLSTVYASSDEGDNLVKNYESEFTYNESGDKLLEESNSNFYDGIPYTYKRNYYYSMYCTTVSVIDIKTEVSGIYPNPFSDQLSFSLNDNDKQFDFELFDSQGHKVMSKRVLNTETISTTSLSRGVYFYILSLDNKIQRGKLIKK